MRPVIAGLLDLFLTKEILKKLLSPVIDSIFDNLLEQAKQTESNLDDVTVQALRAAAKDILAQW